MTGAQILTAWQQAYRRRFDAEPPPAFLRFGKFHVHWPDETEHCNARTMKQKTLAWSRT